MFRAKFEEYLKAIFEVEKIVYDDVNNGDEKDVLYVQITNLKDIPSYGKMYFRVVGTLGINAESINYKYGYLKQRCQLAPRKYTKHFTFGSVEQNINFTIYNDYFVKPKLDFVFRINLDYNPAVGEIKEEKVNWFVKFIERVIK